MKNLHRLIIPALLSLPILLSGSQDKEVAYKFIQTDNYYSFRGSFHVTAESDCLVNLIYDIKNLQEYTPDVQSIELIRQGDHWYDVCFVYRKFLIFENTSTWRRTLKPDENKIVFEMISSENSLKIIPKVRSSTGYYQITEEKKGCRLEYFQECLLEPGYFKSAYIHEVKQDAIAFLHDFKNYIERKCN
ncbi:hypothetical protein JW979_05865 [bacterium]|nr:hypothetical protein [candidate division CSSED10-310 bacterium]